MSVPNVKMNARPTDKFIRTIYAYIERHSGTQLLAYLLACIHIHICVQFLSNLLRFQRQATSSSFLNFQILFFSNIKMVQQTLWTAATTICFTPTRTPTNSIYYKLYLLIILINKSMK